MVKDKEKRNEWQRRHRNTESACQTQKEWVSNNKEKRAESVKRYNDKPTTKVNKQLWSNMVSSKRTKRKGERMRTYGIRDVDPILFNQNHKCPLCDCDINESSHVDHDHDTGIVRGMLCPTCNVRLGVYEGFLKNPLWVLKARVYLAEGIDYREVQECL